MARYIHELPDWPDFRWDEFALTSPLADLRFRQGQFIGRMQSLGFELRSQALLKTLTEDVVKSNEIEGETLDREQVRSSLATRLGMDIGALPASDRHIEGAVAMMLDATQRYSAALSTERLFAWHAALFPTGRSGMRRIATGRWRGDEPEPMQVVSGPPGREKIHFEAPAAMRVNAEMLKFLAWFNQDRMLDAVLKAAIAHLWFVTIHPFEDGNGRIARAIADMALARSENSAQRFYSMSAQIRVERKIYYEILEESQKGELDITLWLKWFLDCLARAIGGAGKTLENVLNKARFWDAHASETFNDRQRKILNLLLDGFEGKLTSSKWATLGKCSQDTASRDIGDLLVRGVLVRNPGSGRSTSYALA